jgi:hypothetical protein
VARHDWRDDEPIYMTLLQAVADHTGEELTELPPLWHVLDPESLDGVLQHSWQTDAAVGFRYNGCRVSVDTAGTVTVSSD